MKRLEFGLANAEREVRDERRRDRNRLIVIVGLWLLVAWISFPN